LITGLLLLILGLRIFLGNPFVAQLPLVDDFYCLFWLQRWSEGVHDWSYVWSRHSEHPMELYNLLILTQFLLNGGWDARLDFLLGSVVHTFYAAVVILTFWDLLPPRYRGWLIFFIFALFAIPMSGYRISWGFLWPHAAGMAFSLAALYFSTHRGQIWSGVVLACLCAALAATNNAAGCLGAFMVFASTVFRAALAWRISRHDIVCAAVCLGIFLGFYLTMPGSGRAGFIEGLNAMLKTLGWPLIFVPLVGGVTLVPLVGLALAQIFLPSFRQKNVDYMVATGGLIVLIALATGAFRGDNDNAGMPSGRYYDLTMMVPLISGVSLCLLYLGCPARYRRPWLIFSYAWLCLQVVGFSVHIFYRVIPFVSREDGEWRGAQYQTLFRNMVHGASIDTSSQFACYEQLGCMPEVFDIVAGKMPMPGMTIPMITGFSLQPGSQGDFHVDGYPPAYDPVRSKVYWGSYELGRDDAQKSFRSGTFKPESPYLTIDVLVDNHSRLTNYRLEGQDLALIDETTGQRDELLPRLSHSFPFVFRDSQEIYAPVTPGHEYRIESSTSSRRGWLAFSEPYESGKLTPLIVGFSQSGKLLCICGLAFLVVVLGLDWMEKPSS